MKALITGASSGLGRDFAKILSEKGYDLILVARRKEKLEKLKRDLNTNVRIIPMDLSNEQNCYDLFSKVENEDIEIIINNAGFGLCGEFNKTDLDTELNMIDLNIKAVHILTKAFLYKFKKANKGYILNIASSAGFMSGPLMATYYATKGYVLKLSEAIYEELRREKSNVHISVLCPGPVNTEFDDVAGVKFVIKGLSSEKVTNYAINKMFKNKTVIIPGIMMKVGVFALRLIPRKLMLRIAYRIQHKKSEK